MINLIERCWKKYKNSKFMLCSLSSSKRMLLRDSGFISEKIIDGCQTTLIKLIRKDVELRTKTANVVPTVFENSKYCAHYLRANTVPNFYREFPIRTSICFSK